MGALTFTLDTENIAVSFGNKKVTFGTLTFSGSYSAGGDTYDPSDVGLAVVDMFIVQAAVTTVPAAILAASVNTAPFRASGVGKVAAFATRDPLSSDVATADSLIEVTAGTSLTGFSARFMAIGV